MNERDTEARTPASSEVDDIALLSGEALDDDALDELCDATMASIGEIGGRQLA